MAILRLIAAVVMPPTGVWNRGCVTVLLVGIITGIVWFFAYLNDVLLLAYWVPGILVALLVVLPDIRRTPAPTEDRSEDIIGAARSFKQQSLSEQPPTTQTTRRSSPPSSTPPKPPWED